MKSYLAHLAIFVFSMASAASLDTITIFSIQNGAGFISSTGTALAWMGNSGWMTIILLLFSLMMALFSKTSANPLTRKQAKLLLHICVVTFLIILISGTFAQLLKHLIGRARPDYFSEFGAFYFAPFSANASYHSFPSGHSTTIAAVMTICVRLIPKYWCVFFVIALLGGGARVAGLSHFPSDVVAGWMLGGMISFVLLEAFVAARVIPAFDSLRWRSLCRMISTINKKTLATVPLKPISADINYLKNTVILLLITFVSLIVFISFPQIDLKTSAMFYDDLRGFWLASIPELNVIRGFYALAIIIITLSAFIIWCLSVRATSNMQIHWNVWSYIVVAITIGPGLITNAVFKTYWGRARPAHIEEFGGESHFTLPFQLAEECLRNCSFVSGEGSGIAMLTLVIFSLFWQQLRKSPLLICSGIGISMFGVALRVLKGRHFLSDTIFAILLMALVLLVLYRLFEIDRHRRTITWSAFRNDICNCLKYVIAPRSHALSLLRDLIEFTNAILLVLTKSVQIVRATYGSTRIY